MIRLMKLAKPQIMRHGRTDGFTAITGLIFVDQVRTGAYRSIQRTDIMGALRPCQITT